MKIYKNSSPHQKYDLVDLSIRNGRSEWADWKMGGGPFGLGSSLLTIVLGHGALYLLLITTPTEAQLPFVMCEHQS